MNATIAIDTGTGSRTVKLDAYLDAAGEERAQTESRQWIKAFRHLRVGDRALRARFTLRGDSLWWFAEIYLHKEQAMLSAMRAAAAFDGLVARERPLHVRWIRGDAVAAFVILERARAGQIAFSGAAGSSVTFAARRLALRVRASLLHAAGGIRLPSRTRIGGRAPILAFVHRAFAGDGQGGTVAGERYIGRVLAQLEARTAPGAVQCIGIGPQRNFRARRWWDPLLDRDRAGVARIEQFARGWNVEGSRTAWRERHRWLAALNSSEAIRRHAVIGGIDCWPIVREQLAGIAWLQWPWSARAMDQAAAALEALRPSVCLTYAEAGGWGRAIALECRRRGIPLTGLQHGFIHRHWLNYRHEPDEMMEDAENPEDRGFPRPDVTLVFDEYAARHLMDAGHFPATAIRVTGSPVRDGLVQAAARLTPADIAAARRASGAGEGQTLVLLATKFVEAYRVLPQLVEAVGQMPSVHLAIKTHPAETPSAYTAARSLSNVTVLPASAPLAPLLAASTAVVTVNSTVAVDALALGIPALVVGLPNNLTPFVDAGAMLGADGPHEIAKSLSRLINDEVLRAGLLEAGRSLTRAPVGCSAAAASAAAVLELSGKSLDGAGAGPSAC